MESAKISDQPPPYSEQGNPGVQNVSSAPPPYTQQPQPQFFQPGMTAPPAGFVPNYGATQTIIITPPIVTVGACPACRVGILEDDFTCLGLMCAIIFFPLGILCCLALKNRRCSNCGAYFA